MAGILLGALHASAQIENIDLLKQAVTQIQPFKASWELDKTLYPDKAKVDSYTTQIEALSNAAQSGDTSKNELENSRELASRIQKITETMSISYFSSVRFRGAQEFTSTPGSGTYEYYSSGNGITYSENSRQRVITLSNRPQQTAREIAGGQPLLVLSEILANISSITVDKETGDKITFSIKLKDAEEKVVSVMFNKTPFRLLTITTSIGGHPIYELSAHYKTIVDDVPAETDITNYFVGLWTIRSTEIWNLKSFTLLTNSGDVSATDFQVPLGYLIFDQTGSQPISYPSADLINKMPR